MNQYPHSIKSIEPLFSSTCVDPDIGKCRRAKTERTERLSVISFSPLVVGIHYLFHSFSNPRPRNQTVSVETRSFPLSISSIDGLRLVQNSCPVIERHQRPCAPQLPRVNRRWTTQLTCSCESNVSKVFRRKRADADVRSISINI